MAVCPGCVAVWRLLVTLKVGVFGVLTVPTGIYGLFLPNIISLLGLIRVNLDIKLIG